MKPFDTIQQALDACEERGYEPRTQYGNLGEVSYWVYRNGTYSCYYGKQFLAWANAYFSKYPDKDPEYEDDQYEEDSDEFLGTGVTVI